MHRIIPWLLQVSAPQPAIVVRQLIGRLHLVVSEVQRETCNHHSFHFHLQHLKQIFYDIIIWRHGAYFWYHISTQIPLHIMPLPISTNCSFQVCICFVKFLFSVLVVSNSCWRRSFWADTSNGSEKWMSK